MFTRISLYLLWSLAWTGDLINTNVFLGLLLISYLATGGNYTLYLLYHTAGRDARGAWRYLQLLVLVYVYQKRNLTVSQVFQRTVKKHPDKVCMYFEDEKWTFREVRKSTFYCCKHTTTYNTSMLLHNSHPFCQPQNTLKSY